MTLTTRAVRKFSFAILLAVLPLVQQVQVLAEECWPYSCDTDVCRGSAGAWRPALPR
jgi:hypothetical protein